MRMTRNRLFIEEQGFWDLEQKPLVSTFEHSELRRHDMKRRGIVKYVGPECLEIKPGNTVFFNLMHTKVVDTGKEVGLMIPEDYIELKEV